MPGIAVEEHELIDHRPLERRHIAIGDGHVLETDRLFEFPCFDLECIPIVDVDKRVLNDRLSRPEIRQKTKFVGNRGPWLQCPSLRAAVANLEGVGMSVVSMLFT